MTWFAEPIELIIQVALLCNCHCPGILLRYIHALYPAYVNTYCVCMPYIYNSWSLEELKDELKKEIKSART